MAEKKVDLPKLIILYGPPGSGKGTQANLLSDDFSVEFLDAGHSFREFVSYFEERPESFDYKRALRVKDYLLRGVPILTEDFLYIIKQKVENKCVIAKETLIMDKPGGSLIPEAKWMNELIIENKIDTCFFHLLLPLEIGIERATSRWYVPGSKESYLDYDEAKNICSEGENPIQREDDLNTELIKSRYEKLYGQNHQQILDIFKDNKFTRVFDIDSTRSIVQVHKNIINILIENYN